MKKVLILITFLATSTLSFSQSEFGVKAGLNFSNAHYNLSSASPEGRTGFYIGSFVDFTLNNSFHLQPEIMYSREGIKDGSIDYVNIPVTIKWYFIENVHLNVGPQVGILTDAEGGTNGLNTTNLAGVFGFGYESPGGFMIDTRYSLGLANIIDEDVRVDSGMGYTLSGIKAWTRAFQIGIGFKF